MTLRQQVRNQRHALGAPARGDRQRAGAAEEATAYAGLAPHPYESAIGCGGNGRLRTALYLATLSAAQHNPHIKPLSARLRAAGKPKKVARCAAARKLLHLAWAVTTKGVAFDPTYQTHHACSGSST